MCYFYTYLQHLLEVEHTLIVSQNMWWVNRWVAWCKSVSSSYFVVCPSERFTRVS